MSHVLPIVEQMELARRYNQGLVDGVAAEDWFRQPSEGVSHVAWQVGHLAVAQFFLTMDRIRGRRDDDAKLLPDEFFRLFGKGSTPEPDPGNYPAVEEILAAFAGVHAQAVAELAELPESVLDEPVDKPHPAFSTKGGALRFCPLHEMLHAGQIGLLRRLLGNAPLR